MAFHEPSRLEVALINTAMTALGGAYNRGYVDGMGLKGDEAVLEFGPGSGHMSRYILRALPRGRLTIVDLSSVWIDVVRKAVGGRPNVELLCGRIPELPIPDGAFDVVVASYVIHDVDEAERPAVARTLAAKLKPGGRMFVRDPVVNSSRRHGISGDDLRSIMRTTGLKETSFEHVKPRLRGPMNQGVYVKK